MLLNAQKFISATKGASTVSNAAAAKQVNMRANPQPHPIGKITELCAKGGFNQKGFNDPFSTANTPIAPVNDSGDIPRMTPGSNSQI